VTPEQEALRDRIAEALAYATPLSAENYIDADMILAACPEIAALDHAREGWLLDGDPWFVMSSALDGHTHTPVLVVPKPEEKKDA
jgi:hypothetical protein